MSNARPEVSFIYPNPVTGRHFIGRQKEIAALISNLENGQSTAFYGAPGSGRTSLLLFLNNTENLRLLPGQAAERYYLVYINLKASAPEHPFVQEEFWSTLLRRLQKKYDEQMFSQTSKIENASPDEALTVILESFARNDKKLVLLIDNFSLLYDERAHPGGKLPAPFHHRLRNFAVHYPLVIFCTTDRFLTELDNSDGIWFSPLINIFQERACGALSRDDLSQFNSTTLVGSDRTFSTADLDFMHQLTFGFPILCQISADKLYGHRQKLGWEHWLTDDQRESIFDETYLAAQQALAKLWTSLTADERIILMYILLAHRGGRDVNNISYKISKNDPDLFGFKGWRVNRLIQFQLVMQNKSHDRYEIASPLLERFVADQVRSEQYPELEDRKTRFLVFSQAQFDRFKNVVRDHEAVFIEIGTQLFKNWMSRD